MGGVFSCLMRRNDVAIGGTRRGIRRIWVNDRGWGKGKCIFSDAPEIDFRVALSCARIPLEELRATRGERGETDLHFEGQVTFPSPIERRLQSPCLSPSFPAATSDKTEMLFSRFLRQKQTTVGPTHGAESHDKANKADPTLPPILPKIPYDRSSYAMSLHAKNSAETDRLISSKSDESSSVKLNS